MVVSSRGQQPIHNASWPVRKQPLWSQSRRLGAVALISGADERLAARDPAASVARLVTAQCALDCSLLEWRFGRRARARRRGESASARRHAIKMKIKMKGAADQNENKNEVMGYRFSICAANSDRLSTSTRVGVARSHDSGGLRLSEYCSVRCVSLSQTP